MVWNNRKGIYNDADETAKITKQEELREAWEKYSKACHDIVTGKQIGRAHV